MKKDLIFAPILFAVGGCLGILHFTGMTAHIILSGVGALVLIAYTVLTTKEWKIKPLEIGFRVSYGIALITGIIMKVGVYHLSISIIHKVFSILFLVILLATFIHKIIVTRKKN